MSLPLPPIYTLKISDITKGVKLDNLRLYNNGYSSASYLNNIINDVILEWFKHEYPGVEKFETTNIRQYFSVLMYEHNNLITYNDLFPLRDGLHLKFSYTPNFWNPAIPFFENKNNTDAINQGGKRTNSINSINSINELPNFMIKPPLKIIDDAPSNKTIIEEISKYLYP